MVIRLGTWGGAEPLNILSEGLEYPLGPPKILYPYKSEIKKGPKIMHIKPTKYTIFKGKGAFPLATPQNRKNTF